MSTNTGSAVGPAHQLAVSSFLDHAGCWFLRSGIQESSGGVARYYRTDTGKNLPVSNEITAYTASALVYLHSVTGDAAYLDSAILAARFLSRHAWDPEASAVPFEPGSDHAYFFDTGIIVRGLLAVWRATGNQAFLNRARDAAQSLAVDFLGDEVFHPVISLPDKQPFPYERWWSRMPGCLQLKAALAWRELGEEPYQELYESMLEDALRTHTTFLAPQTHPEHLMDRLHPYGYFLEGLLPAAGREDVRRALADGLSRASEVRREIAPLFERSDAAAQLLRVRLIAHNLGAVALDEAAAEEEADRVAWFQAPADHPDVCLTGGFFFGAKHGKLLPFSNPVSTAFCMQALQLWRDHQEGCWSFELEQLI